MRKLRRYWPMAIVYLSFASVGAIAALPYTYVGGPYGVGTAPTGYNPVATAGVDGSGLVQFTQTAQTVTVLSSAARTVATASGTQTNYSNRGVVVTVNITAASGTGGLNIQLQVMDSVSGNWVTFAAYGSSTKLTAVGTYAFLCYPGASGGTWSNNGVLSSGLPQSWRVNVAVGDATSYTYSVATQMIP